jgi:ribbon-helix-helix CopG family protein
MKTDMKKKPSGTKRLRLMFPVPLVRAIDVAARRLGLSRAAVIRLAIQTQLDKVHRKEEAR